MDDCEHTMMEQAEQIVGYKARIAELEAENARLRTALDGWRSECEKWARKYAPERYEEE